MCSLLSRLLFTPFSNAASVLAGMVFAERTSTLREEALAFQVLFAAGAVEALAVVVVVQRLDPFVTGFDREAAGEALGREQIVPVLLAVRVALLEEERAVAELLAAVRALEALRMELLANGIQAIALNSAIALRAQRGQELLEAVLAVQVTLLLDESDIGQRTLAVGVVADEVIRAPDASQSGDEWSSDLLVAASTERYTAARSDGLVHHTTTTIRCRRRASGPSLVERVRTCTGSGTIRIIVGSRSVKEVKEGVAVTAARWQLGDRCPSIIGTDYYCRVISLCTVGHRCRRHGARQLRWPRLG
uniref:Putative secreted protein n=1 Tax=Anopheles darlingi TaxID=43151 RepID=A0A2M4D1M8_ANODA